MTPSSLLKALDNMFYSNNVTVADGLRVMGRTTLHAADFLNDVGEANSCTRRRASAARTTGPCT